MPSKRFGEAFHPCVVQYGFGTESAVTSVGGCTILLFSVIIVVCHIVSSERVPIIFWASVGTGFRSIFVRLLSF